MLSVKGVGLSDISIASLLHGALTNIAASEVANDCDIVAVLEVRETVNKLPAQSEC